jgi:hypothetical protein
VSLVMFVTLLVVVAVVGLLLSYFLGRKPSPKRFIAVSLIEMKQQILDTRYFRNIQRGDFARPLARVYSQMDMALIESILSARNIASQRLFTITNNMRTGLGICGYNDIWLIVLNTEYYRAREVMLDYIRGRKKVCRKVPEKTRLRNVVEALLFRWAANADYRLPELLRIGELEGGVAMRTGGRRRYSRARLRAWV